MSIGSIEGDASQTWQALKESRAKQAASNSATSGTVAAAPQDAWPGASAASKATGVAGPDGISSASAKVITDLKALFIDLQAGNTSNAAGSTNGSGGAAPGTNPTATGSSPSVQSDLNTLAGDLSKVGGHGGHHHGGHGKAHAASSATASTDLTAGTDATAGTATTAAAPAKPSGSLFDQLAGALKAYAASSLGSTTAPTAGLLSA